NTTNPPRSSSSLPSTVLSVRPQLSLMPFFSISRARSLVGSGATSSGGRTGVFRPQADKESKAPGSRLQAIENKKKRTQDISKVALRDSVFHPLAPSHQPVVFGFRTPAHSLCLFDPRLRTLDSRLIYRSPGAVFALLFGQCLHTSVVDQPRTLASLA